MCFRFGSGTLPCGEPFKVRVTTNTGAWRGGGERTTRRVVCEMHYLQATTPVNFSAVKQNAKNDAMVRLAAAHPEEFQALYEEALARQGVSAIGLSAAVAERVVPQPRANETVSAAPADLPSYLTVAEVASMLRTSPETVRYWRHVGKGPKSFKSGRRVLYAAEDVESFISAARGGDGAEVTR